MAKFIPPQGMKSLSVTTRKGKRVLNPGKDGLFEVNNPKLAKKLKEEGLGVASTSGVLTGAVGYPCSKCGFSSLFKKCGKCGETNE